MKHLVLMKFKPGTFSDPVLEEIKTAYSLIQKELSDKVLSYTIRKGCTGGDHTMDLLIELTLSGPDVLSSYLSHPAHVSVSTKYNPDLTERCSFDYEE